MDKNINTDEYLASIDRRLQDILQKLSYVLADLNGIQKKLGMNAADHTIRPGEPRQP